MKKLVLTTLASAFTISVAYAAETETESTEVTQEHINAVLEQIEQLKTHVTTLEGKLNQQNQKISTQNEQINRQNQKIKAQNAQLEEQKENINDQNRMILESREAKAQEGNLISTQEELIDADENTNEGALGASGIGQEEQIFGIRKMGIGTGHEFGLDSEDDGTQLLITAPQLNKDYNLLLQNQYLTKEIGSVSETGARVQLSGLVEAIFNSNTNPFGQIVDDVGNRIPEDKSDLLGSAEFDIAAEVNDWWTGYMHFYSDTEPGTNVQLEQAFLILGNLDKVPTYASAGLAYLSNGYFYTNMASRPLTREIGRTRDNQALLGTTWGGLRASIFGFDSERPLDGESSDSIDQWGGSFDYTHFLDENVRLRVGAGYINDNSGAEAIQASDVLAIDEPIKHYIPAVNVHGRLDYEDFIFFAEYQDNLRSFTEHEISYNGEGAKISAGNFEVTYNFDWGRPSWLTANYGFTTEALGVQLPQSVYGVTYGVIVLKNTYLSFEYLIQQDYKESDTATAASNNDGHTVLRGQPTLNNQLTAQVDIFF